MPELLPATKLYLDDIEEITDVLRSAYEAERRAHHPVTSITYEINKQIFETVSELSVFGGETNEFIVAVNSRGVGLKIESNSLPRLVLPGLSVEAQWAVYGKIRDIVSQRRFRTKAAVNGVSAGWKWGMFIAWSFVPLVASEVTRAHSTAIFFLWALLTLLAFIGVNAKSTVVLTLSRIDSRQVNERNRNLLTNALFMAIGAVLSVLLQALWDHLKKQ